ncbi:MAG TPA: dipeptidase PepE [Aquaticitalea sp.]|nr:dipeptidase PepE [Aquaticitalea sp.]HNU59178.1 dipeptidase PepE [Aquaticitalea sp.]
MKQLLLASTSTVHGSGYLEYLFGDLSDFFCNSATILFIPYARPSGIGHNEYTKKVAEAFEKIGKKVTGIHEHHAPLEALAKADGIFAGGGNTFLLLNQLYKNHLLAPLRDAISDGVPYLGTSAGSNICGLSISTTNDMPIVYPPSFKSLGVVPFNINPHYLDPDPDSTHKGETRETRIKEFHKFNTQPVVGLREGSWLMANDHTLTLKGLLSARIFEYDKTPYEVAPDTDLSDLK